MRCQFPGFFPLKKGEYADFLKSAVISYDANILLNLYRIKPDTAALFYKLLDKTKNQTFISNQATYEFLKNRTTVIYEHDFSESNRRINAFIQKTRDNLKTISGFRFREIEKIASEI